MKEEHFPTLKTARYFQLGELGFKTKTIWFVFHGYGQLANEMLENFKGLENESTVIVAPEGFSRFYKKGFYGGVGASWMTKEDRETEVKDYIIFINNLYHHLTAGLNVSKINVNLFGFSQGVATAFRVFANNKFKVEKLILWSSPPPVDLELKKVRILSASTEIKIFAGKKDNFFSIEKIEESLILLNENKVKYEFVLFEGGHQINKDLLQKYNLP